jgi:hypothetical protein
MRKQVPRRRRRMSSSLLPSVPSERTCEHQKRSKCLFIKNSFASLISRVPISAEHRPVGYVRQFGLAVNVDADHSRLKHVSCNHLSSIWRQFKATDNRESIVCIASFHLQVLFSAKTPAHGALEHVRHLFCLDRMHANNLLTGSTMKFLKPATIAHFVVVVYEQQRRFPSQAAMT